MWYVNHNTEQGEQIRFWGFILTMWYVNLFHVKLKDVQQARFILTMWYVNLKKFILLFKKSNKFYINYVVCKSR